MIYFKKGIEWDYYGKGILNAIQSIQEDGGKIYLEIETLPWKMYDYPTGEILFFKKIYVNDKKLCSSPGISFFGSPTVKNDIFTTNLSYPGTESLSQTNIYFDLFVCDTVGSECFILLCGNGGASTHKGMDDVYTTNFGLHYSFAQTNANIICFNYNNKLCSHNTSYFGGFLGKNNTFGSAWYEKRSLASIYNLPTGVYTDIESENEDIYIEKLSFNTSPVEQNSWYGYGEADNLYISSNLKRTSFGTVVKDDNNNKFIGCGLGAFYLAYSDDLLLPSTYSGEIGPYKENVNEEFLLKDGPIYVGRNGGGNETYNAVKKITTEFNNDIIIGGLMSYTYAIQHFMNISEYFPLMDRILPLKYNMVYNHYRGNMGAQNPASHSFRSLLFIASPIKKLVNINNFSFTYGSLLENNNFIFNENKVYIVDDIEWYYNYIFLNWSSSNTDECTFNFPCFNGSSTITDFYNVNNMDLDTAAKIFINKYNNKPIDNLINNINVLFPYDNTVKTTNYCGDNGCDNLLIDMSKYLNLRFYNRYHKGGDRRHYDCIGSKYFNITDIKKIKITFIPKYNNVKDIFYSFYVLNTDTVNHCSSNLLDHKILDVDMSEKPYYKYVNSESENQEYVILDVSELEGEQRLFIRGILGWDGESDEGWKENYPSDINTAFSVTDIEFIYDE